MTLKTDMTMKECRTCICREHKDDFICCQCNHLAFALRKLLKSIPFLGKIIPDYKCKGYERDNELTGFPQIQHVNCRCSFVIPPVNIDEN